MDEETFGRSDNWSYYGKFDNYTAFELLIQEEYPLIADAVADHLRHTDGPLHILDIGCGTGRLMNMLVERLSNPELTVDYIDRYEAAVRAYEQNLPQQLLGFGSVDSWEQFPVNEEYNVLLANNSLGSMDFNNQYLLKKFRAGARADGVALITLPSDLGDYVRLAKTLWEPTYGRSFEKTTIEDAAKAFQRQGFSAQMRYVSNDVDISGEERDDRLRTIFSIMMRLGAENLPRFEKSFTEFKGLVKEKERMRFTYGVMRVDPHS